MPTLRILNDGRVTYATPGAPDQQGVPAFAVGGGNVEMVALDFTAWLGAGTLAASTWTVNGAVGGTETNSGGVASILITVPSYTTDTACADMATHPSITIGHIAQCSDGRALRQLVRLVPQPSSTSNVAVFDLVILG